MASIKAKKAEIVAELDSLLKSLDLVRARLPEVWALQSSGKGASIDIRLAHQGREVMTIARGETAEVDILVHDAYKSKANILIDFFHRAACDLVAERKAKADAEIAVTLDSIDELAAC
ncbi:hypothetical protein ACEUZ9_004113 [Paracoccus litorisediminis]|uniref:hypothetical protein n=1 Tax=Paracoccus litorisediminis TaxID=2006130 RepID=UPI003733D8F3